MLTRCTRPILVAARPPGLAALVLPSHQGYSPRAHAGRRFCEATRPPCLQRRAQSSDMPSNNHEQLSWFPRGVPATRLQDELRRRCGTACEFAYAVRETDPSSPQAPRLVALRHLYPLRPTDPKALAGLDEILVSIEKAAIDFTRSFVGDVSFQGIRGYFRASRKLSPMYPFGPFFLDAFFERASPRTTARTKVLLHWHSSSAPRVFENETRSDASTKRKAQPCANAKARN